MCDYIVNSLGILHLNGKGNFLIAGFNTKSTEDQEKYNITALSKFMGIMMFCLAFSMVFWVLSDLYKLHFLFIVGMVLFVCIILFMLMYINTNYRFKKVAHLKRRDRYMNKKLHYQIGTIFIIASGFIYTIERFISYYSWIGVGQAIGKYPPNSPELPGLFTNISLPLFLVIGAISFISGYRKND